MKLAMRNPGVFSSVYSLSPANMANHLVVLGTMKPYLMQAVAAESTSDLPWQAMTAIAQAAAFAPDPSAEPFFGHFPVNEDGEVIDSIWNLWLQHDPYAMIPGFKDSLLQLQAIQMDCGTSDDLLYDANVLFSGTLDQYGIEHVFQTYEGNHTNRLAERAEEKMLPFFSRNLVHDDAP
jgi:S-formylglutathione hydrolase